MPTQNRDFLIVGVTGGIGSGKSSVCALFSERSRPVLSADLIARHLTESDPLVVTAIRKTFGNESYRPDGTLDRKRLAERVFARPPERAKLNRIVHPRVFTELDHQISVTSPEVRRPYLIVEAALIFETGMDRRLDRVIVVDADEETRIHRVMERDGCDREEVLRRIEAQMPVERKRKMADFIILNNGTLDELRPKVAFFDNVLRML